MKKDNNIILSNNLTYYMNKMKIDRNKLCKDLGFKYTTVSEWLSAQKYPRMDKIEKLANYFGVKKSDLIESKNPSLVKHNDEISESELQHIKKYRNLDDYGKEAVNSILNVEYKRCTSIVEDDDEEPEIKIKHSTYKVSAGTGFELGNGDDWETISIPDSANARKADFALTIQGDSMEPVYLDGDIVLVKEQSAIDIGQIGIYIIEGNGYIKKYGGDRLISLNAEYDDIIFSNYDDDRIKCVGKVIGRV